MPPLPESPYRLLVEGSDDRYSVIHLVARHGFDWDDESTVRPYVSSTGGAEKLLRAMPVALKSSYERIGIILDADSGVSTRWAQIRSRAEKAGVDLPDAPHPDGTILPGRLPGSRIGFWIMPDNSSSGALEDFLSRLVPDSDPTWSYAGEVVMEARGKGAHCQVKDHSKSVLHTWLAWQEEPGLPFGTALRAEILNKDSDDARRFVSWFQRLFVEA